MVEGIRECDQYFENDNDHKTDAHDAVDLLLEWCQDAPKCTSTTRQSVGCALRTHALGDVLQRAGDAECAREYAVSTLFWDPIRFAREQCLVNIACALANNDAIGNYLFTGSCDEQIAGDHLGRVNRVWDTVAYDSHLGPGDERDMVQYVFRIDLLDEPNGQVDGHDSDRKQGIRGPAQRDERNSQSEQDRIDEREDVVTQDPEVGSARRKGGGVGSAAAREQFHFAAGEATALRDLRRFSSRDVRLKRGADYQHALTA